MVLVYTTCIYLYICIYTIQTQSNNKQAKHMCSQQTVRFNVEAPGQQSLTWIHCSHHHTASRQLNRAQRPSPSRLGIKPWRSVAAKARMMFLWWQKDFQFRVADAVSIGWNRCLETMTAIQLPDSTFWIYSERSGPKINQWRWRWTRKNWIQVWARRPP